MKIRTLLVNHRHWSNIDERGFGLPRKILFRGNGCGLSGDVLGTVPGSRRVLGHGRDSAAAGREETPPDTKASKMERFAKLKPALWGAAFGAVAISIIGFSQFGWTLGSTAERMANERAQTAVVGALGPICVERFQRQADAPAKLAEFNKVSTSWDRRSFIENGGSA